MSRFCAVLTWHLYALIKWEGAACDSENMQSPKVASQECEREFKVSFYRFFFHPTDFSGKLGGWDSARKTSKTCCWYTPDMRVKIFSVHVQQLSGISSIGEGTECELGVHLKLTVHQYSPQEFHHPSSSVMMKINQQSICSNWIFIQFINDKETQLHAY